MIDSYFATVIGKIRNVFADIIGQRQLSFFHKDKDRRSNKLLSYGTCIKQSVRRDRRLTFQIRRAISLVDDQLAVLRKCDGATRLGRFCPREDLVDLR